MYDITLCENFNKNIHETCLPWQGRVYADDVWSGGTKEEAEDKKLPLLSTAIEGGLFHPNCKHSMFTYYYDRKKFTGKLQEDGIEVTPEEQEHRRKHLHIQQQKRLEEGSLDPQNIAQARQRKEEWIEKQTSVEQRQKIRRNYGNDLAQYERYKQVLGDEFISTFEDFRHLKYTDESKWENLKNKYRTVNRYKVDYGEVKASKILVLDKVALENKNSFSNGKFRKNGNVAVLQYENKTKVAFSKINETTDKGYSKYIGSKEDVILLSNNRKYKTAKKGDIVDGKISKIPRKYDSEAKMFEYMRELHPNKNDKFEFTILSERNMCESCRNVKDQFQNEYKNAKINIVSGKKFVRHKKQQNGTVKEVEVSPWDWRKG